MKLHSWDQQMWGDMCCAYKIVNATSPCKASHLQPKSLRPALSSAVFVNICRQ